MKPVSEMTYEELVNEVRLLRERRASARERAKVRAEPSSKKIVKVVEEATGKLGGILDDILGEE